MVEVKQIIKRIFQFKLIKTPTVVVTSYFVPSWLMIIYRVICLAYITFVRVYSYVLEDGDGYYYFTVMSHEALLLYFAMTTILSIIMKSWRIKSGQAIIHEEYLSSDNNNGSSTNNNNTSDDSAVHVLRFAKVIVLLHEIVSTTAPVVVLVYWSLLYSPQPNAIAAMLNVSVHGINWPMIWIDTIINRIPHQFSHVIYILIQALLFAMWSWFYRTYSHQWIYFFLNYYAKTAPIYYIGLMVGFALVYTGVYFLVSLRTKLGKKFTNHENTRILTPRVSASFASSSTESFDSFAA